MFHFCLHLFIFVFCVFFLGQFFCWTCFLCNFVSTLFLFCLVFSNQKGRIFFLYNCFFYVTVQKKIFPTKKLLPISISSCVPVVLIFFGTSAIISEQVFFIFVLLLQRPITVSASLCLVAMIRMSHQFTVCWQASKTLCAGQIDKASLWNLPA